jgi:hypothetical protein
MDGIRSTQQLAAFVNYRESHMNLIFATLPQFEISEIKETGSVIKCSGIIKNLATLLRARSGWIVTICVNQNEFIKGKFSEINSQNFQATIDVSNLYSQGYLVVGKDYPLLDGYWGDLVELVFNNSITWKQVKFEHHDSTAHYPDGKVEIIKGGWDHEHCQICSQTISTFEKDNNYGYVNQDDNWLCESCYQRYVLKKSLDFINLNQVF